MFPVSIVIHLRDYEFLFFSIVEGYAEERKSINELNIREILKFKFLINALSCVSKERR